MCERGGILGIPYRECLRRRATQAKDSGHAISCVQREVSSHPGRRVRYGVISPTPGDVSMRVNKPRDDPAASEIDDVGAGGNLGDNVLYPAISHQKGKTMPGGGTRAIPYGRAGIGNCAFAGLRGRRCRLGFCRDWRRCRFRRVAATRGKYEKADD